MKLFLLAFLDTIAIALVIVSVLHALGVLSL